MDANGLFAQSLFENVGSLSEEDQREFTKLAAKASSGVVKQKCSTMPQLLEYLPLMKHRLYQLKLAAPTSGCGAL